MTKIERTHLLRVDDRLFQRINKQLAKQRPYLKSRNYFLIELIEIGLDQLDKESKIYGGNYREHLKITKKAREKYAEESKNKGGKKK